MAGKKWIGELAAGRVFELKTRSTRHPPPLILIAGDPDKYGKVESRLIRERGMMKRYDHHPSVRSWMNRVSDFTTARVARRRRDLERYDARDLELIRYGSCIDFTGSIDTGCTRAMIPTLCPGIVWTIFWTKKYPFLMDYREVRTAMRGTWHFESWAGGDWRFGRDSTMHAWCTAETDRRKLNAIERILRRSLNHLERREVRMVEYVDQGARVLMPLGHCGPAVRKGGVRIEWPNGNSTTHFSSDWG
jgi:hypothetical protein